MKKLAKEIVDDLLNNLPLNSDIASNIRFKNGLGSLRTIEEKVSLIGLISDELKRRDIHIVQEGMNSKAINITASLIEELEKIKQGVKNGTKN